jgi:hypothetical protein
MVIDMECLRCGNLHQNHQWCGIKYIAPGIDKKAAVVANVAITKMMRA